MNIYESLDIETLWIKNIAIPYCIAITKNNKILYKKINLKEIKENIILKFLLNNCYSNKIYYVHNLTFEAFVFLKDLIKENIKFKIIISNKIVYSMTIYYKNKTIRLRCSYRLTLLSLDKLATLANEEKKIFPYKILNENIKKIMKLKIEDFNSKEDYKKFKEKNNLIINTDKLIENYCKNDVIITKNSIIKFWELIKSFNLKNNNKILTAASLSINNFFNNIEKNTLIEKNIKKEFDDILRKSYFGGRTEVFGNPYKNEKILHFDFPGMYASVMCENIPNGKIFLSKKIDNTNEPGFYLIKFKQNMLYPILPIKEDKLYFKNGTYEGWYWFEEINLFIKYGGTIIEIKNCISFQFYNKCLKNFININNLIRKKGGLYKIIGKNNNNTFYGRIGMNPNKLDEEIINNINFDKYSKIKKINEVTIGYKKSNKKICNVSISSAITAKARIKLYIGFMDVINNEGRILYCDTDSIIASFSKENKIENKYLGKSKVIFNTKLEDTEITDATFALPKTYGVKFKNKKEIVKIKGFNNTCNYNKFKWYFYNNKKLITKNNIFYKKNFEIENILEFEKSINLNNLSKRKWIKNKKETIPL